MTDSSNNKPYLVFLHGLARTARSLRKLERYFSDDYDVINLNYPSTKFPIETLSNRFLHKALSELDDNRPISFITHSMGGIVLRHYLHQHKVKNLNRVVMLAPPNKGSELVDKLSFIPVFRWINGPASSELSTQNMATLPGTIQFELGIIAGTRSFNPFYSALIEGDDDGKVSVESTKIDGMKDHLALHLNHTFLMNNITVLEQCQAFLQTGKFDR